MSSFTKLPIMGKNVEVTLTFNGLDTKFQIEPEKWSEKRVTTNVERKPLGLGQRKIKRATLQEYELTLSGAKVSDHLQRILAHEDKLNETGDALQESMITVKIEITNPNDASIETRTYTNVTLQDASTDAQDLEGNVEESVTLLARTRKIEIDNVEQTDSTW